MTSSAFAHPLRTLQVPFDPDADVPLQGWLGQLFRRPDTHGAVAVVERTLARRAPGVPSADVVAGIFAHFGVSPRRARELAIPLWLRMLHMCLRDDVITDEAMRYLTDLRITLNLRERDVNGIWEGERASMHRHALEEALGDNRMTDDEWRQLEAMASALRQLPVRRAEISARPLGEVLQRAVEGVVDDRAALLWRIENEELPTLIVPIRQRRGEGCHCAFRAAWYEPRTQAVRTHGRGPVGASHIMKGLSYRAGSYQARHVAVDELTLIDEGTVYITNSRLIFNGTRRSTTIRYGRILSLTPYGDGVGVETATGTSPTLVIQGDAEIVTALAAEALNRA
jgi:hypothetical protein